MDHWRQNQAVFWGLMDSFIYYDSAEIYALNVPDNLSGTFMFRDFSGGSSFIDGLKYTKGKEYSGVFNEVCQYNMLREEDGVRVEQLNDSTIQVSFNQFGNWFWKRGEERNYETADYRVIQGPGHYKLQFKKPTNALLIYQDGDKWKKFTLDLDQSL